MNSLSTYKNFVASSYFTPSVAGNGGLDTERLRSLKENSEGLKKACEEFEAIFINMLFQQFRKSVPDDGLIPKSFTMKTYEEMLDREMATNLAKSEKFGISRMMFRQLSKLRKAYQENLKEESNSKNKGVKKVI